MLTNYSSVKAFRWVASKSPALLAVKENFALTVLYTEDVSQGSKNAKTKGKAASIHKEITTVRFVKMLHLVLDLMDITETSKIFHLENLTRSSRYHTRNHSEAYELETTYGKAQ